MIYDVNYFIRKFEAMPESLWCAGSFNRDSQKCVYGHCGINGGVGVWDVAEARELFGLLKTLRVTSLTMKFCSEEYRIVAGINDGDAKEYQQPTPKQRILAALYDIKKLQEKKADPKPLHIYHAVQIPETLVEKGKELVTLN